MTLLRFVDLSAGAEADDADVVIGVASGPLDECATSVAAGLDVTLTEAVPASPAEVQVPDLAGAQQEIRALVEANPSAAAQLCSLLRRQTSLSVEDGLEAESLMYSSLLAGPEFARWRASRPVRPIPEPCEPAVLLKREDGRLQVTLNRPERRNAFGVAVRDGLVEAFDLVIMDESITSVVLAGNGPAFCSGGDLDEFGSNRDSEFSHRVRMDRSVARRIHTVRDRVRVDVHGACIGAGIELPSFAGHIAARVDARFALPEIQMGLIPGAGGTVGMTRRIGRWRTAYLALAGAAVDTDIALDWGLIDEVVDD